MGVRCQVEDVLELEMMSLYAATTQTLWERARDEALPANRDVECKTAIVGTPPGASSLPQFGFASGHWNDLQVENLTTTKPRKLTGNGFVRLAW
jgi:hypothetical protein